MIYRNESLNTLASYLERIDEPRDIRGRRYRLIDILILAIYGFLWGHVDFVNMVEDLNYHEEYFTSLLGLENGIPSHDTFSAVFSVLDHEELLTYFLEWMYSLTYINGQHIAIDGKAIRAACEKIHKGKIPYLVNTYMVGLGVCIGQIRIDEKTNEIKGIPEMLKWLDIEGSTVTIDAIGCQKEIARLISQKKADYILPVKENQPQLHSDIELDLTERIVELGLENERVLKFAGKNLTIERPIAAVVDVFSEMSKGHSRIERRTYYVSTDITCVDQNEWPSVAAIGMAKRERLLIHRDKSGNIIDEPFTEEQETYILSRPMSAEEFGCYVRGHWGIENCLHWVLDDHFREDRCTSRKGQATENLGLMRKTVYNLMNMDPNVEKKSMKGKQVYYQNSPNAIEKLLFEELPKLCSSHK
jgi:predicted transposase YbfD/YdcC